MTQASTEHARALAGLRLDAIRAAMFSDDAARRQVVVLAGFKQIAPTGIPAQKVQVHDCSADTPRRQRRVRHSSKLLKGKWRALAANSHSHAAIIHLPTLK